METLKNPGTVLGGAGVLSAAGGAIFSNMQISKLNEEVADLRRHLESGIRRIAELNVLAEKSKNIAQALSDMAKKTAESSSNNNDIRESIETNENSIAEMDSNFEALTSILTSFKKESANVINERYEIIVTIIESLVAKIDDEKDPIDISILRDLDNVNFNKRKRRNGRSNRSRNSRSRRSRNHNRDSSNSDDSEDAEPKRSKNKSRKSKRNNQDSSDSEESEDFEAHRFKRKSSNKSGKSSNKSGKSSNKSGKLSNKSSKNKHESSDSDDSDYMNSQLE